MSGVRLAQSPGVVSERRKRRRIRAGLHGSPVLTGQRVGAERPGLEMRVVEVLTSARVAIEERGLLGLSLSGEVADTRIVPVSRVGLAQLLTFVQTEARELLLEAGDRQGVRIDFVLRAGRAMKLRELVRIGELGYGLEIDVGVDRVARLLPHRGRRGLRILVDQRLGHGLRVRGGLGLGLRRDRGAHLVGQRLERLARRGIEVGILKRDRGGAMREARIEIPSDANHSPRQRGRETLLVIERPGERLDGQLRMPFIEQALAEPHQRSRRQLDGDARTRDRSPIAHGLRRGALANTLLQNRQDAFGGLLDPTQLTGQIEDRHRELLIVGLSGPRLDERAPSGLVLAELHRMDRGVDRRVTLGPALADGVVGQLRLGSGRHQHAGHQSAEDRANAHRRVGWVDRAIHPDALHEEELCERPDRKKQPAGQREVSPEAADQVRAEHGPDETGRPGQWNAAQRPVEGPEGDAGQERGDQTEAAVDRRAPGHLEADAREHEEGQRDGERQQAGVHEGRR